MGKSDDEIKTEQLSITQPIPWIFKGLREFGFTTLFAVVAYITMAFGVVSYVKDMKADRLHRDIVIIKKLNKIEKSMIAKGCKLVELPEDDDKD